MSARFFQKTNFVNEIMYTTAWAPSALPPSEMGTRGGWGHTSSFQLSSKKVFGLFPPDIVGNLLLLPPGKVFWNSKSDVTLFGRLPSTWFRTPATSHSYFGNKLRILKMGPLRHSSVNIQIRSCELKFGFENAIGTSDKNWKCMNLYYEQLERLTA